MTRKWLKRIDLFGGQGYIELVDSASMGNRGRGLGDNAVVDGARVSFGRQASQFSPEKNAELAEYLWEASDASPFYQFLMQFRVRVPIHIALEWFMFRWAWYNEISGRYTRSIANLDQCFVPIDFNSELAQLLQDDFETASKVYSQMYSQRKFEVGEQQVAKELARSALLYSFSTEFIFTLSLRKLAHFLMFFAGNPQFGEISEALMKFVREYAPIFARKFEPFLDKIRVGKHLERNHIKLGFENPDGWVLGESEPYGAVRLYSTFGYDSTLAERARWSYGLHGPDRGVIRSLVAGSKRDDLPPELSLVGLEVAIRCPVYVFRQMYRHQRPDWYGLTFHRDQFFIPTKWRAQTRGSRYVFEDFDERANQHYTKVLSDHVAAQYGRFQEIVASAVPVEQAERFLPYCFYVTVFRRGDAIDLFNMLNLRCDWHAQAEHRAYANRIAKLFAELFPLTFMAWKEEYWTGRSDYIDQLYAQMTS